MSEADRIKPLDRDARMADANWPGVVAVLPGGGWRLAVNATGTRYALQTRIVTEGGEAWAGRSYARLSAVRAAGAERVRGLAEACEGLPEDPREAKPEVIAARAALGVALADARRGRKSIGARSRTSPGSRAAQRA